MNLHKSSLQSDASSSSLINYYIGEDNDMHDPSLARCIIYQKIAASQIFKDYKGSKIKYQSIKREELAEGNDTKTVVPAAGPIVADVHAAAVSATERHKPAVRGKGV